ncbi:hypothetical protein PAPHI01_1530 [Pancytospora philotis]|nr:hypothetical protein PAPHI01_1530 [Pancytospora philotis]
MYFLWPHVGLSGLCFADDTLVLARSTEDAQDKMDRVERWMVSNGMRINVQKCGVMAIGMPEAGPVFYQGALVPRVSKHVYLGEELNDRLDPMEMAQHRLKKGWNALCSMKNVLRNQEIALSLRRQLVSGMLIPRAQFGVALYAHNYACLAGLRKIHNCAIAMIAGKPNVCTAKALDELKLPSIHEAAFFFKMKSLASWERCEAGRGAYHDNRTFQGRLQGSAKDHVVQPRCQIHAQSGFYSR